MELETLLREGRDMIDRTSRAHRERWGLGSAQRWVLDQDDGRIVWSFEDHIASAPAQILGSWNGKVSSFVWSWDNDSSQAPLRTTAEDVRAIGLEHGVGALSTSPLKLNEEQVRDLVAVAFRLAGCTGLYHHYDGVLATYITFGPVTVEEAGGRTSTFETTSS
jgi:hypothetical protein